MDKNNIYNKKRKEWTVRTKLNHIILKGWIDFNYIEKQIKYLFGKYNILAWKMVYEEGHTIVEGENHEFEKYRHTHIIFALEKSPTNISVKSILYLNNDCIGHWHKVNGMGHYTNLEDYVDGYKQDKETEIVEVIPPYLCWIENKNIVQEDKENKLKQLVKNVDNCNSLWELCRGEKYLDLKVKHWNWIKDLYATRRPKLYSVIEEDGNNLWPIQKEYWDLIKDRDKPGKVIWIVDKKGQSGKSSFCDWLYVYHDGFAAKGKVNDVKHMYDNQKYVFIDYTRTNDDPNERISYGWIEECSNGRFNSGKFYGCVKGNPELVLIIFANMHPHVDCLSRGRWIIKKVENNKLYDISEDDAQKFYNIEDEECKVEHYKKIFTAQYKAKKWLNQNFDLMKNSNECIVELKKKIDDLSRKYLSISNLNEIQKRKIKELNNKINDYKKRKVDKYLNKNIIKCENDDNIIIGNEKLLLKWY